MEFVLLVVGIFLIWTLCEKAEKLFFRNSGGKKKPGSPREHPESEPENLADRYLK